MNFLYLSFGIFGWWLAFSLIAVAIAGDVGETKPYRWYDYVLTCSVNLIIDGFRISC